MNQARPAMPSRFLQSRWSRPTLMNVLVCVMVLSIPVVGLSMRYAMSIFIVVMGPMQLLRAIPYDIRLFIAMRGRTCFTLLQLLSFSRERGIAPKRLEVVAEKSEGPLGRGFFEALENVAPMRRPCNAHWRIDNKPRVNALQRL